MQGFLTRCIPINPTPMITDKTTDKNKSKVMIFNMNTKRDMIKISLIKIHLLMHRR